MKKALLFCLFLECAFAQQEINPGGTKDQEMTLPGVEDKAPQSRAPVKYKAPHQPIAPVKKHKPKHHELTPLQKKLEQKEGPVEKYYWKTHHSASVGYRRDRQKFSDPLAKHLISSRNTMQLILGSHLEIHKMVFQMRGQYGWMLDGNYNYTAFTDVSPSAPALFSSDFKLGGGYTADVQGTAGMRFKIYSKPKFAFSFIPSAGYKYSHVKNFTEKEKQFTLQIIPNASPGTTGFSVGRLPKPNQQDWFGPFVEGRIEFRLWDKLNWDLYYQYHWIALRSKSQDSIDRFIFNPATTPIAIFERQMSSVYKARITHGQVGGTHLRYIAISGWNFGFHFEGSSVYSKSVGVRDKNTQESFLPMRSGLMETMAELTGSIHWVTYQISIFLGHQF